ncbi:hypothetical protein Goari_004938 [Gossypium aridum]|uniref:Uncharacterized protein n=1 Tax=Gossypium aridum TaxID=34290 RepID=A0A7J8Y5G2_GOSAI|nr:hypothetical protein [Gossypium aridum]
MEILDVEKVIADFEVMTKDVENVQRETLKMILEENRCVEYSQNMVLNGRIDPESFKACVPLFIYSSKQSKKKWGLFAGTTTTNVFRNSHFKKEMKVMQSECCIPDDPNPELADLIEKKCSRSSNWYGLIPELFPNVKYIYGIMTRSRELYLKNSRHYVTNVPLISVDYGSSKG